MLFTKKKERNLLVYLARTGFQRGALIGNLSKWLRLHQMSILTKLQLHEFFFLFSVVGNLHSALQAVDCDFLVIHPALLGFKHTDIPKE